MFLKHKNSHEHTLNQSSVHFVQKAVFILLGLFLYVFIEYYLFSVLVLPYYHSQLATTIREDLIFVSERMYENGYGEKISCEPLYQWPYTRSLQYLTDYTDLMANQYVIKGIQSLQKDKVVTYPKSDETPDILGRIEIPSANDIDANLVPVFNNIEYNIAITSDTSKYNGTILKSWLDGKQNRLDDAAEGYQKAKLQYEFNFTLFFVCLFAPLIFLFFFRLFFVFRKKRHHRTN